MQINHNNNNNFEEVEGMKISEVPTSSLIADRESFFVMRSSSSDLMPEMSMSSSFNPDNNLDKADENTHVESKVYLSTNMKTDVRDCEILRLCKSKRVFCQDTIHESEEDDGLTMEKVGK